MQNTKEHRTTRPRGFTDWNPKTSTLKIISQVQSVLVEYSDQLPLTIRQIFYRLVAQHGFEKTERGYSRLQEYLNRARRAAFFSGVAI